MSNYIILPIIAGTDVMMYFCTLFDKNYISKGIALYLSLARYTNDFVLYIMSMDRDTEKQLKGLCFNNVVVDCIEDHLFPALIYAKTNRSRAEYCWTCGSVSTYFFINEYNLPEITYLDSDLMFFNSPSIIDQELKKKGASVGLSPHFISIDIFGRYCVQYVYFKNDANGICCLKWWRDNCLEWCYSKLEDGKYGDQKYLDFFSSRFEGVKEIENLGAGIAYWNMDKYQYDAINSTLSYNGSQWPIVFFHYSGINIRVEDKTLIFEKSKYFTREVTSIFIIPYAKLLSEVYTNYLNTPISLFHHVPSDYIKYFIQSIWIYFRKYRVAQRIESYLLRKKYMSRTSPYSERNKKEAL